MKKLLSIMLLFALAVPAFSQEVPEQKWTVKASVGYLPTVPTVATIVGGVFAGIAISANKDNNEELAINMPPFIGVEALYSISPMWSVGLSSGYCASIWKVVDKDTKVEKSRTNITFVPITVIGRCNYLNRPKVKLYGSLEAGAMLHFGNSAGVIPEFQVNPIGVEFGRKFFGMVELGGGFNYIGARAGIGYRF